MINNFYQADDSGVLLSANDLSNINFNRENLRGFFRKEDLPNMIIAAEAQLQVAVEISVLEETPELTGELLELAVKARVSKIAGVRIYNYDTRDLTLARVVGTNGMEVDAANVLEGTPIEAARSAGSSAKSASELGDPRRLGDGSAAFFSSAKLAELNNRSDIGALLIVEVPLAAIADAHLALEELEDQAQNLITEKDQLTTLLLIGVQLDNEDKISFPSDFAFAPHVLSNRPVPGYAVVIRVQATPGVFPDNDRPALKAEPYLVPWDNKDKPSRNEV